MSGVLREAILIAATMTMGLMAGVFGIYSNAIMPGLRRADDRTFVAAFQSIDRGNYQSDLMATFLERWRSRRLPHYFTSPLKCDSCCPGLVSRSTNDSSVIHPQVWMNLWRSRFEAPERLRLDDFGALPKPGSDHPLTGEKSANNHDQARQQGRQPGVAQQSGHSGVCQQEVAKHHG